jgi:hypothetical protein
VSIGSNGDIYKSNWGGNQYVTTTKIGPLMSASGYALGGLSFAWDSYNLWEGSLSAAHFTANTAVGACALFCGGAGLWGGVAYGLTDAFYPGGIAGAMDTYANTVTQNQAIDPGWRARNPYP